MKKILTLAFLLVLAGVVFTSVRTEKLVIADGDPLPCQPGHFCRP